MKLQSNWQDLGEIALPEFQGRQKYMHTFDPQDPVMCEGFEDYLDVVTKLCQRSGVTNNTAHMTVDEKVVQPGMSQRRPGAHVDGCYLPELKRWGHPPTPGSWRHYTPDNYPIKRMSIIVASSVPGCTAYEGEFVGWPKDDGDLEHIRPQLGDGVLLPANQGFLLSPDCVHESMRFSEPTQRTFLRIAFHLHRDDPPWKNWGRMVSVPQARLLSQEEEC